MIRLRLRGPASQLMDSFDGSMAIEAFVLAAAKLLGCDGKCVELLIGYPPKPCAATADPISSILSSGDSATLRINGNAPSTAPI